MMISSDTPTKLNQWLTTIATIIIIFGGGFAGFVWYSEVTLTASERNYNATNQRTSSDITGLNEKVDSLIVSLADLNIAIAGWRGRMDTVQDHTEERLREFGSRMEDVESLLAQGNRFTSDDAEVIRLALAETRAELRILASKVDRVEQALEDSFRENQP